jgi:small nuclear ribonucleoprotein
MLRTVKPQVCSLFFSNAAFCGYEIPFCLWYLERFFITLLYLVGGSWIIQAKDRVIDMMMEPSKKPLNVLIKQLHGNIEVVLKNGYEYKGKMIKCDGHMNLLLEGATECKEDQLMTNYGNVLLRGNNILYIVLNANIH